MREGVLEELRRDHIGEQARPEEMALNPVEGQEGSNDQLRQNRLRNQPRKQIVSVTPLDYGQ
jgi:hypothetical protein